MKARTIIGAASFGPEKLKAAYKAFDDAWERLAPEVSKRPRAIEVARIRLANIILRIVKEGDATSVEDVTNVAVDIMRSGGDTGLQNEKAPAHPAVLRP